MAEVGIPSNFVRFLSSLGLHCMTIIRFTGKGNDEHWYYQIATKIKLVIPKIIGAPRNTAPGIGCA
jgi:ubiquinone biosynthesis protein COQ9